MCCFGNELGKLRVLAWNWHEQGNILVVLNRKRLDDTFCNEINCQDLLDWVVRVCA